MKARVKSSVRLFKKQFARLVTIAAIVIVSIGFMSGLGEVESKINSGIVNLYNERNISDLSIKSFNPSGFSSSEIEYLQEKFGTENVFKLNSSEFKVNNEITRVYNINLENNKVNKLKLIEGEIPKNSLEILAERGTKELNEYSVGDKVTIQGKSYTISGIVESPLLIQKTEEFSLIYSGEIVKNVFYIHGENRFSGNEIYITFEDRTLFNAYSDAYEAEIDSLKEELKANLPEYTAILSLYENAGIYSLNQYAAKVGMVSIIFVVFFLLVTLLVVYSTMSRLLDEERSQIACMRTLGYSNLKITSRYTSFVAISSLVGGLSAFIIGMILTKLIYEAFNLHFLMPKFPVGASSIYYLITFAIIFFSTIILTFFTGLKVSSTKPAKLLTPKAPKAGKKVLLERIKFVWKRLSFKYKSSFRNVFLFKSRFFMTVISVIGSTVLVFAGMSLMDSAMKKDGYESLVIISGVIIAFSSALCALVVYNLTNINVSERNREIATLMVLGYHDKEVANYIFREIYIMSLIGAVIGVPVGIWFMDFAFELIDFGSIADINWWTYILTPILTMIFSFVATRILYKKIIKTDMNESLKTVE